MTNFEVKELVKQLCLATYNPCVQEVCRKYHCKVVQDRDGIRLSMFNAEVCITALELADHCGVLLEDIERKRLALRAGARQQQQQAIDQALISMESEIEVIFEEDSADRQRIYSPGKRDANLLNRWETQQ
jgi:hypothetical protein